MTDLTPPNSTPTPASLSKRVSPWWARATAALPLKWVQTIGTLLGWLAYCASPSYRRKFNLQWNQAAHNNGDVFTAHDKRGAIGQSGMLATEAIWIWLRPQQEVVAKVMCNDTAVLDAAEQAGNGIIFLTPHLGAFEVTARYYATRAPVTVLFKPSKLEAVNSLLSIARELPQLHTAPADSSGVRKLLRALKKREAIGLLPDQVPGEGQGEWAPYFGKPAYTMTLPHKLAELTGASLILAVGERLPDGQGWQVHFEKMIGEASPQEVNSAMQALVAKLPSQYLWGYNRYKNPSKVLP